MAKASCLAGTQALFGACLPWRLTVRTTCKPSLTCSQRSGLTMSGTGGNSGKRGKTVRGGRLPQLSRL